MERGHAVSVVYYAAPFAHSMPREVEVRFVKPTPLHHYAAKIFSGYRLWARRLRSWELSREIEKALEEIDRKEKINVVEITEGLNVRRIGERWATVVRAHGSDWAFRHFCRDGETKWDGLLIREQAEQFRRAEAVSPLSKHYAAYLSETCGIPRARFETLPYPIDERRFHPQGESRPDMQPLALMSVGRLERRKGTDMCVRAMNQVWKRFAEARLYLLGGEAQFTRAQLRQMAEEKFAEKVFFSGFVAYDALPSFYRGAKIYLALTQYETFGYTILEAMSCGVPVVACDSGAVKELVEDGVNGRLVPFGDAQAAAQAIIETLSNEKKRALMGVKARETALQYSLDTIGQKHIQMYEQASSAFGKTPSLKTGTLHAKNNAHPSR